MNNSTRNPLRRFNPILRTKERIAILESLLVETIDRIDKLEKETQLLERVTKNIEALEETIKNLQHNLDLESTRITRLYLWGTDIIRNATDVAFKEKPGVPGLFGVNMNHDTKSYYENRIIEKKED